MQTFQLITFALICTFLILLLLNLVSRKYKILIDTPSKSIRRFHQKLMIKTGGFYLLTVYLYSLFFVSEIQIIYILNFAIAFMLIGFISDIKENLSPLLRIFLFLTLIFTYLLISKNYIQEIDSNGMLIYLFSEELFLIIFTILSFLLLINGINLIDGLHGLKTGYLIQSLIIFLLFVPEHQTALYQILIILISSMIIFFIINFFFGNIRAGDTGSYFLGFVIGAIAVYINNLNIINSFHIACILMYPIIDVTYSYYRRLIKGTDPFKPDESHLHSLLYNFLIKKGFKDFENANRLASLIILISLGMIQILILNINFGTIQYAVVFALGFILYIVAHYYLLRFLNL